MNSARLSLLKLNELLQKLDQTFAEFRDKNHNFQESYSSHHNTEKSFIDDAEKNITSIIETLKNDFQTHTHYLSALEKSQTQFNSNLQTVLD